MKPQKQVIGETEAALQCTGKFQLSLCRHAKQASVARIVPDLRVPPAGRLPYRRWIPEEDRSHLTGAIKMGPCTPGPEDAAANK